MNKISFLISVDSDGYTDIFDPTKTSSDQNSKDNVLPPKLLPPSKNRILILILVKKVMM